MQGYSVLPTYHAGVTVGFERSLYSFAEPSAGTSLIREQICVTISSGELGIPLVIVPQWTADSATGVSYTQSLQLPKRFT